MNVKDHKKQILDWFCHLELREDSKCSFVGNCQDKCYEYNSLEKMLDGIIEAVADSADSIQVNAIPNTCIYTLERVQGYNDHCSVIQFWKQKIRENK